MKVAIIVDKEESAIGRLSKAIARYNPHLHINVVAFHPKRPDPIQISEAVDAVKKADIMHIAYWKSGEKLKEFIDQATWVSKKKVLCHYNPYDLNEKDWIREYDRVVVGNKTMLEKMPSAELINYGIDLETFRYNENYTDSKRVLMVVARIEGKKGVREVAQVCHDLQVPFRLVGRISSQEYFEQIKKVCPEMEFYENVPDEDLPRHYYESAVHVCNSIDNFESGTLPILEAMACGVPVLTRNVGHVPELYSEGDGGNMVVRLSAEDDIEELKKELSELLENRARRDKIRDKAWDTVKNWGDDRMAWKFCALYYNLKTNDDKPFVSVIIPTFDRPRILIDCLSKIVSQQYDCMEVIVSDSGNISVQPIIEEFRKQTDVPIRYIRFENHGEWTLAQARNRAVVESQGELLVFCDERMGMRPGCVEAFVRKHSPGIWQWGIKDDVEKGFVENLSAIMRVDLTKFGMFNERINYYGGTSQELRTRFSWNSFDLVLNYDAKADTLAKNISKSKKRDSIRKAKLILYKLYG
jgi:glycosyltransferase involved in cell wall biosynthesis